MRSALAVSLALASGAAAALGLGQIQLKSGLGEPLLAEIPIISNDPSELERLRASLASPATFARVGLQPPDAVMSDLQFVSALDARGNPVIRVTSTQPITQPLLTFLVEVDWGQGRLVREYSTLIDAPRTAAAPMQPPIQAPQAAPSNTIVREPDPVPAPEPAAPQDADPVAAEPPEPEPDTAPAPITVPPPQPAPRPVAQATPVGPATIEGGRYDVQAGDTLSAIAGRIEGASLDAAMIALLRANPEAFIDGNIHMVKAGAVLQVPDASVLAQVDSTEAAALVRAQTRQWREATAAVPQPAAATDTVTEEAGDASTRAASGRTADARLEIVPPGASDASTAGTQSGVSAGGEGDMLQQELQTTQETLAARDAELDEMKSRLAELEKLQQQQQQLLEMKDSELAAAQQRLAQSNDAQGPMSATPWLVGGGAVLLFALLGWWFGRRRAATPVFRAPPERTSSIADAFPSRAVAAPVTRAEPAPTPAPTVDPVAPARGDAVGTPVVEPAPVAEDRVDTPDLAAAAPVATAAADEEESLWNRRERDPRPGGRAPTWHDGSRAPAAAPVDAASGHDRLELARAYVALGDHGSARQLLEEVAGHGDPDARQQAERMLRDLA